MLSLEANVCQVRRSLGRVRLKVVAWLGGEEEKPQVSKPGESEEFDPLQILTRSKLSLGIGIGVSSVTPNCTNCCAQGCTALCANPQEMHSVA